ncbi:hypothetical protein SAE02_62870 [Skermanella aerolata]|uniref:Uncharacterized protein n=1 Tax=Skermanella aerolata TaxID=393310 RepID=A0A512E0D5_9PROT|nr:hypothetical protein [Skermanella aerolata]KJB91362.1 hypothetical protein N826_30860 [Skermanella aerolata KACC 11604]GEO42139.1 hypothetical protein SAE02_62870 [Skermanella aerolata]
MACTCFVLGQLDFGALVLDPEIIAQTAAHGAAKSRAAAAPKTKPRRCLHCSRDFASTGPGNWICSPCKGLEVFTCSPSSFSVHASF